MLASAVTVCDLFPYTCDLYFSPCLASDTLILAAGRNVREESELNSQKETKERPAVAVSLSSFEATRVSLSLSLSLSLVYSVRGINTSQSEGEKGSYFIVDVYDSTVNVARLLCER